MKYLHLYFEWLPNEAALTYYLQISISQNCMKSWYLACRRPNTFWQRLQMSHLAGRRQGLSLLVATHPKPNNKSEFCLFAPLLSSPRGHTPCSERRVDDVCPFALLGRIIKYASLYNIYASLMGTFSICYSEQTVPKLLKEAYFNWILWPSESITQDHDMMSL